MHSRSQIGVLHGFRALFIGWIGLYHIWQQGWLGQYIDLFGSRISFDYITRSAYVFVDAMLLLSAWLLYLPAARSRVNGEIFPVNAPAFWKKRLERILPSYLFAVICCLLLRALPQHSYMNSGEMMLDVLSHLTFTFTFFRMPYLFTPLNGALWTIVIEMQFYLLFPLLARCMYRRPVLTLLGMAAVGFGWRTAVSALASDTAMLLNQLPAFGDVFALGFLCAMAYARLEKALAGCSRLLSESISLCCAGLTIPVLMLLSLLLTRQSASGASGADALRLSQMALRLPFAVCFALLMLCAAFWPRPFKKVLDNRLTRFLSAVSMNFYIWHQVLAVEIRAAWFPDTALLHADRPLQMGYTVLCLCVSLLTAMAVTKCVEGPGRRLLRRAFDRKAGLEP